MNRSVVLGILRHILTVIGSAYATKMGLDGEELDMVIGSVITLAAIGWSIYEKRTRPLTPPVPSPTPPAAVK